MIKTKIWEPYQLAEKFGKDNKKFKAGQFDVGENQSWKAKLSIFVARQFLYSRCKSFLGKTFRRIFRKIPESQSL